MDSRGKLLKKSKALEKLVSPFGLNLIGWNPGVIATLKDFPNAPSLDFTPVIWGWLEPLLKELKERRENERKG